MAEREEGHVDVRAPEEVRPFEGVTEIAVRPMPCREVRGHAEEAEMVQGRGHMEEVREAILQEFPQPVRRLGRDRAWEAPVARG